MRHARWSANNTIFSNGYFSSVTVIILATLASLLPDICHTQSKIGRRFKVISFCEIDLWTSNLYAFNIIYRNHSILLQIIQTPNYYMAAIIIGLVSHVILDMITPKGVKLFYPLPFNVKTPIQFKTGGLVDLSLATALMIGTVYVLFQPFINDIISNWNTKFYRK